MKKLPQALKSRRLRSAYSVRPPNATRVSAPADSHRARRSRLGDSQERRDEDAFDEREEQREDDVLRKLTSGTLRHDQRREHADHRDERVLRSPRSIRRLLRQRERRSQHRDEHAEEDQPVSTTDQRRPLSA